MGVGERRLRGLKALVHDAVDGVADLVEEGHESTARTVMRVTDRIEPVAAPARVVNAVRRLSTAGLLGTIKAVNRAVEVVTDAGIDVVLRAARAGAPAEGSAPADARAGADRAAPRLEPAVPLRSDVLSEPAWIGDAALGLVNAAVGDRLRQRRNGLDLGMVLRAYDHYLEIGDPETLAASLEAALAHAGRAPAPRVAVFVHGLGTTEWSWALEAEAYHGDPGTTFGALLERDLGITPLYVRYNTGTHVSENGRALAALLETLAAAYPAPLEELVLCGHSMGGLVVRSACHYGTERGATWLRHVRRVFCLGSPHQGAPLEKLGNVLTGVLGAIDLPGTLVPARILERRSAGIKDLRHGALVDEDWLGRDPDALRDEGRREVPLLPGVAYHFVSATVTRDPAHPLGHLVGDLLVRVPSARGPAFSLERPFAIETAGFGGVLHHQLQNHPAVYEVLRRACAEGVPRA